LLCSDIYAAYERCILIPKQAFHNQLKRNNENQRIKLAMAPIMLSNTAKHVALVLGKENPSPQPVLHRLIEETATNTMVQYERRIKSLEDELSAATASKKVKGDGTKPKSILCWHLHRPPP
jgi:hypothetical protein